MHRLWQCRWRLGRRAAVLGLRIAWAVWSVGTAVGAESGVLVTNLSQSPAGGVRVQAFGTIGMVYSFQVSTDLRHWRTLDFTGCESGEAAFQDDSAAGVDTRFYRVRLDAPNTAIWWTNYHGWSNSIAMSNGQVEAAIVPAVGRMMQFRWSDQADGPFWENSKMYGQAPTANSWSTEGSFGGDKVWPSPQSWPWPPPRGFDSLAYTGTVAQGAVTLTGPLDSAFGIRVIRRAELHPAEPILRVSSRFEKLTGRTNQVGVWVVTQVKDAERVFAPIPVPSVFPRGYVALGTVPRGTVVTNGLVSLARDPSSGCKIGNDAGAVLWVGTNSMLLIESPRVPGLAKSAYPDGGCSAEVYTNPNSAPYIELELLGPLARLGTNDTLEASSIYTLFRRSEATPLEEAQRVLER